MPATLCLLADSAGFHLRTRLQHIDEGRFSHAARSCHRGTLLLQISLQHINTFSCLRACKNNRIQWFINLIDLFLQAAIYIQICFVKTDDTVNARKLHSGKKGIQQHEVWRRTFYGKDHNRLIHVGNKRPDQFIFTFPDLIKAACLFFFIQNTDRHIIPDKRLFLFIAKASSCLTFI